MRFALGVLLVCVGATLISLGAHAEPIWRTIVGCAGVLSIYYAGYYRLLSFGERKE